MFKKKYITLALTFILAFCSTLKAEIVKELVIEGNNRISEETIKLYGEIELNNDYSEIQLNQIIKNLYSTNFFRKIDVKIKNNILRISVEEYPVINQLIFVGEKKKAYREEVKKLMRLKEKQSFVKSFLVKDIETIKQLYSSLGYNFAEVDVKVKDIDKSNLDLLITLNRGEKTKITSINFVGNKKIRTKRLRDVIASEEDKFWKVLSKNTALSENLINLDQRLLINYYKSIGFYNVKLKSNFAQINQSGSADLVYTIEEGNRYIIDKISTNVEKVFDKKIFFPLNKEYKKYTGEYYSPFKIKQLLEEIDLLIEENNLQFVEHNVEEIVKQDTINIVFNIFEGEKNLIERINITGNYATNEDVIRSELILDEGDPLTQINLDKSISQIKARRLFKNVKYKVSEGSENNLKIIDISVEEQPTGEIGAGAGIGTSGGTIAFNIKENNWLGEGKGLAFDVQLDEESIAGDLTFTDPNYDFLGNSLFYRLSSERNDKPNQGYENSVVSASTGTSFEQYRDIDVSLSLSASYDDLTTVDSASASLKKQSGAFSEFAGSYGFTYDKRNRAFMPTSGSIISFNQSLPIYADRSFILNTLTGSKYHSFNENVVGSGKFFLSSVNGLGDDDVRLSKRRGLSSKRLRGFEKNKVGPVDGGDHIGGNYAAAINFGANLPNLLPEDTNADIELFLDFGNIWGVDYDSSIDNSNKVRSSTGVAMNWISPIGPLSFVLSQDLSKADTDETESFSFNLGTTF
tara:strand:+ start:357 stop:2597 length:2241 start_codon:yes stop_codon:yes gene_type:complete